MSLLRKQGLELIVIYRTNQTNKLLKEDANLKLDISAWTAKLLAVFRKLDGYISAITKKPPVLQGLERTHIPGTGL